MAVFCLAATLFAGDATFELRGHVNGAKGVALEAMLFGVESPFEASTPVATDGSFHFRSLASGQYTIALVRPNVGEIRRTVVISPALADSKGVIDTIIPYSTDLSLAVTSARQISIPKAAVAKYSAAQARLGKHDAEGAIHLLKEATAIAPEYSSAWNALGVIAFQTGDDDQAEAFFRKALDADPEQFEPMVNLGGVLLKKHRNSEALFYNERAAHDRPEDALANAQLGMNYFQLGRFVEAEPRLLAAKAADPAHFAQPQIFLAEIYAQRGDRKGAIQELEDALARHPDSAVAESIRRDIEKLRVPAPTGGGL